MCGDSQTRTASAAALARAACGSARQVMRLLEPDGVIGCWAVSLLSSAGIGAREAPRAPREDGLKFATRARVRPLAIAAARRACAHYARTRRGGRPRPLDMTCSVRGGAGRAERSRARARAVRQRCASRASAQSSEERACLLWSARSFDVRVIASRACRPTRASQRSSRACAIVHAAAAPSAPVTRDDGRS